MASLLTTAKCLKSDRARRKKFYRLLHRKLVGQGLHLLPMSRSHEAQRQGWINIWRIHLLKYCDKTQQIFDPLVPHFFFDPRSFLIVFSVFSWDWCGEKPMPTNLYLPCRSENVAAFCLLTGHLWLRWPVPRSGEPQPVASFISDTTLRQNRLYLESTDTIQMVTNRSSCHPLSLVGVGGRRFQFVLKTFCLLGKAKVILSTVPIRTLHT